MRCGLETFEELASILRKTSGIADVLAEALVPLSKNIQAAFKCCTAGKWLSHADK